MPPAARAQWGSILRRQPRARQERFTPVETVLCYGLFHSDDPVINPHRYGGGTMHTAPQLVHDLAALFVRPPGSITSKMMNLDGSRVNGAKDEVQFFMEMGADFARFLDLYTTALQAARHMGIGARRLPDFLRLEQVTDYSLLGVDYLADSRLDETIEREAAQLRAAKLRHNQELTSAETTRIVQHRARVGHKAFATEVLRRFDYSCGDSAAWPPDRFAAIVSSLRHTSNRGPIRAIASDATRATAQLRAQRTMPPSTKDSSL